jgi:hypothetical protein
VEEFAQGDGEVHAKIAEILGRPEHKWRRGLSKDQIGNIQHFYKERHGPTR